MTEEKQDLTDDSSATEITDVSDEGEEEKSDDEEEVEDVSEYYSSDEEVEENLTLAQQLDIEKRNFREAKQRIANLITQVTEYQVCNNTCNNVPKLICCISKRWTKTDKNSK